MIEYIISYNSPDEHEIFTGVATETSSGAFLDIFWDDLIPIKYQRFANNNRTFISKKEVEESSLFSLKPVNV